MIRLYTRKLLGHLIRDERGLAAVEYAVLGAIVVGGIVAIGTDFKANLSAAFASLFANITS